jgi:XRE family aerobic/anaerobic benzoate catabolism transcriptional regulator
MISLQRLGQAVRELRKEAQLTQRGLADRSGVAKQAITNIERGAAFPSLRTLEQLAEALRVPVHMIVAQAEQGGSAIDAALEAKLIRVVRSIDPAARARASDLLDLVEQWSKRPRLSSRRSSASRS